MGVAGQRGRRAITDAEWDRMRRLYEQYGTIEAVADIMGVSRTTVRRCRDRGWTPQRADPRRIAPPADFAFHAAYMTNPDLAAHYGCSRTLIARWLKRVGIERKPFIQRRSYEPLPVPSDFRETWLRLDGCMKDVIAHYGRTAKVVRRWRQQLGMPIAPRRPRKPDPMRTVGWVERFVQERRAA